MSAPRYELKYWIDAAGWERLLDDVRPLVAPDPHAADADAPSYTITSLYFDTPERTYLLDKLEGLDVRAKVRLRRYDRALDGFAELKAKKGRQIHKHRVPLGADALATLARGDAAPLREAHARGSAAAGRLLLELDLRPLRPVVITRYERAAYVFVDDPGVRLTLDRSLAYTGDELVETFLSPDADRAPLPVMDDLPHILELKFSGAAPLGAPGLLRRHGLERRSISKFCFAVERAARATPLAPPVGGPGHA